MESNPFPDVLDCHFTSHPISLYPRILLYPESVAITGDPWWLIHWYGMDVDEIVDGAVRASRPRSSSLCEPAEYLIAPLLSEGRPSSLSGPTTVMTAALFPLIYLYRPFPDGI